MAKSPRYFDLSHRNTSTKRLISPFFYEISGLAILVKEGGLILCTFDAAAIRTLPFLDASNRAISAERLLQVSGLTLSASNKLDVRLSEEYFQNNLEHGQMEFVQNTHR